MALAVQVLRLAEGNKISMTAQMRAICNNHFLFEISQTSISSHSVPYGNIQATMQSFPSVYSLSASLSG